MQDPNYLAVWPGDYGHFIVPGDEGQDEDDTSLANLVVDQAIEECLIARAERKLNETNGRSK